MSLIAWFPLNGNTNNYGTAKITMNYVSSANTNVTSAGKIGQCYYNNSNSAGALLSTETITLGSKQSMCCWVKFTSLESSANLGGAMVGTHRYSANTGMGLTIKYVSSTTGYLSINTGTGSSRTYNTYCGSTLLSANTWYHVAFTYDGSTARLYVNGSLDGTHSIGTMSIPADYLIVGAWSLSGGAGNRAVHGDYKLLGYLNDVRVYDECLSLKQIKEIAKGLMLHYTFEDDSNISPNIFDIENYLSSAHGMNNGTKATYSASGFTITATGTDMFIEGMCYSLGATANAAWHLMPVTEGKTYRISYDLVAGANLSKSYLCYFNSSRVCVGESPYKGFSFIRNGTTNTYYYDFTVPTGYSIASVSFRLGKAGSSGEVITAEHWQLRNTTEFIPYSSANFSTPLVIYDSSGYGNNGTVNGNLQISSDSMSGQYSTKYNGSDAYVQVTIPNLPEYTFSLWFCFDATGSYHVIDCRTSGGVGCQPFYGGLGYANGIQFYSDAGGSLNVGLSNVGWTTSNVGTWYHYVGVLTRSGCKVYLNGVLKGSSTAVKSSSSWPDLPLRLGTRCTGANWFNGKMADFKIFARELTATEILAEYSRKAAIDKNSNLFTGEFVETAVNADITKKNQVKADAFQEEGTKVQIFGGYTRLDSLDMPGPAAGATSQHNTIQQLSISYDTIEAEVLRIGKGTSGAILISGGWYVNFSANPMQIKNTTGVITPTVLPENVWTKVTLTFDTAPTSLKLATWSDATNYWTAQHSEYLYLKAYKNGALVLHLVPVKRNRDNVLGLYDLVAHKFYTNTGTGSFIAGTELGGFSAIKANQLYEI